MAFRTNKMPVLQEKSASGSIATFNTALVMPLVECKTEFMCTQSGTGDPNPITNERPIIPVRYINITDNGSVDVIDLDGERAKGRLDITSGLMKLSQVFFEYDGSENWGSNGANGVYLPMGKGEFYYMNVVMCNLYKPQPFGSGSALNNYGISFNGNCSNILVKDSEHMTPELFKSFISEHPLQVVCDLWSNIPDVEVQLTPTQIETIRGNNSFASDSGSIELKYKDLDIAKRGNFREVFKLP